MPFWVNSSGKIIIDSEGKPIICDTCPCVVDECCMYPWPDLDGIPYPPEDLPATLTYDGDTLIHDAGFYTFTGSTYYIEAGTTQWDIRLISDSSLVQSMDCLVRSGVADEFPEYLYIPELDKTLTRISLCVWSWSEVACVDGDDVYTNSVVVEYGSTPGPWGLFVTLWSADAEECGWADLIDDWEKDGDHDGPLGTYDSGNFTVEIP